MIFHLNIKFNQYCNYWGLGATTTCIYSFIVLATMDSKIYDQGFFVIVASGTYPKEARNSIFLRKYNAEEYVGIVKVGV